MTIKHIVWDWNCTLLDDFAISVAAAATACVQVGGTAVDSDAYRRHFARPVRRFYEGLLGRAVTDEEWRRIVVAYHDAYEDQMEEAKLRAEAVDTLRLAADAGLSQSLLSMGEHASVSSTVDSFALRPYFCLIQGAEPGRRTDAKRDCLVQHLETVGTVLGGPVRPHEVLLVGDTQDDVEAALAVGASCALLSDGCFDPAVADHDDVTVIGHLHEAVRLSDQTPVGRATRTPPIR